MFLCRPVSVGWRRRSSSACTAGWRRPAPLSSPSQRRRRASRRRWQRGNASVSAAAVAPGERARLGGDLDTVAEMLSCGEASMAALPVLRRHGAHVVTVSEEELLAAPQLLRRCGGPATTPSGGAGLAGFAVAA